MSEYSSFNMDDDMMVIKRSGLSEVISFDKILRRIRKLGKETHIVPNSSSTGAIGINYTSLAMKVIEQLYNNIHTTKIDELAAEHCAAMSSTHIDYGTLAGRIVVSNHQKNTESSFYTTTYNIYNELMDNDTGESLLNIEYFETVAQYREEFDAMINHDRDYLIDYFGFKTLERSYLLRIEDKVVERPQHLWMRVAVAIHGCNLEKVQETYNLMSKKYFTQQPRRYLMQERDISK